MQAGTDIEGRAGIGLGRSERGALLREWAAVAVSLGVSCRVMVGTTFQITNYVKITDCIDSFEVEERYPLSVSSVQALRSVNARLPALCRTGR
jgi:hypothetical protein